MAKSLSFNEMCFTKCTAFIVYMFPVLDLIKQDLDCYSATCICVEI